MFEIGDVRRDSHDSLCQVTFVVRDRYSLSNGPSTVPFCSTKRIRCSVAAAPEVSISERTARVTG